MASLNPSTDISSFINPIFDGAMLIARENNVMAGLVQTFGDREGLATRKNSQYGGMTVNAVAETDDLVGQAFTPAVIATLTPAEAAGQYFLTDNRMKSDPFAVRSDAQNDMGLAVGTKIETDLLAVIPSLTGGTIGTAGSTITWAYVYAMEATLRTQKAPYPYFMVIHPHQWFSLKRVATVAGNRTNASETFMNELRESMYFVHQEGGIFMYVSANLSIDANADAKPGMWSRTAMGLDVRTAPYLEAERDASRRGWELNISTTYAAGVWRPTFGVQGIFDATAPTGV